ncbi:site-specific DNA-methyltransferase [Sphingopyxis indica]|uniref:site-specific DNA-methyltransferase (adenine-specific) n=1 Tax=Sphingopyxis indica TaxID=436663 RepID=A0A239JRX2_9SPHN|nr:site-specific DNA-methyltransferase [Sphingopyxis indica]SNT08282.1 adenine-specific DNA-methyltransferase [Sphingopyxis indica]
MPEIKKLVLDDPATKSADIVTGNVEALKDLFPEAFEEGKIDFDVLRQLLGAAVDEKDEKYGLNWHGKRKARQIALTPSTGTLLPCPDESVDWDTTQNLMIEGDNLEVLKLLQKSYAGKVKLIYIDPPYNTGKEFIYPDRFQDNLETYLQYTGQKGGDGFRITSNTESHGRFHTNWLNMIYPRLKLSRALLSDDGVIAISVDENEIDRLRAVMAEIFGEENFAAQISVQSNPRGRQSDTFFATVHEYLLVYARSRESGIIGGEALTDAQRSEFKYSDPDGRAYRLLGLRQRGAASLRSDRPDMYFPIYVNSKTSEVSLEPKEGFDHEVLPRKSTGEDGRWMWGKDKCTKDIALLVSRLIERRGEYDLFVKDYLEKNGEERSRKFKTIWDDKKLNTQNGTQEVKELLGSGAMSFPKPVALLRDVIQLGADRHSLILDFFAGSGTTGHAVFEENAKDGGSRKFILVQLPEPLDPNNNEQKVAVQLCDTLGKPRSIAEVTKERLRRAAKKVRGDFPLFKGDLGFRNYKLAQSNIVPWEPEPTDLEGSLLANAEHLVPGRTELDVLYELLLKLGLDLCVPIEKKDIAGKAVHSIGGGALIVCLSDGLTKDSVETVANGIVAWRKELAPAVDTRVVFKDAGFADDVAKANMAAILNQNGILDVRSL